MTSTAVRVVAIVSVGLFVALLAYGLFTSAPDDSIDTSLGNGEAVTAPGLELPVLQRGRLGTVLDRRLARALADGRVNLKELRGSAVVLNFWASWCVPCRVEAPRLERGWKEMRRSGVVLVGLDMQDVTEDARRFIREFGLTYLNVRDESNDVALDWGVTGIPETFFISARGKVVAHVIGAVSADQLRDGIAAAAKGAPLGALEGGARRSTR